MKAETRFALVTVAGLRWWLGFYGFVLLLTTALEGVGLGMLIPILQTIGAQADDNIFVRAVGQAFAFVGLPYNLRSLLGVFTAVILAKYLLVAYSRHLTRVLSARITYELRRRSFDNLMGAPLGYYYRVRLGDVVATLVTSSQNAGAIVEYGMLLLSAIVFCALYLTLNMLISLPLTLVAIALAGVAYVAILPRMRRGYGQGTEEKGLFDRMNTFLYDRLAGIKLVKAFGTEAKQVEGFDAIIDRFRKLSIEITDNRVIASLFMEPLLFVLVVLSLFVSIELLNLSLASMLAFLVVFVQILPKAKVIQSNHLLINELLPHVARIQALIESAGHRERLPGVRSITAIEQAIRCDGVSYSYPGTTEPALEDVTVEIKAGTTTAIVGGSGGGKTTLVDLLLRLHDPQGGRLTVDGVPLTELSPEAWHRLVGVVEQEPYLFNETVLDNIRYGQIGSDPHAVEQAAVVAHAHEFISQLPDGYQTMVGTRGMTLSGGQKQRIALARALVRHPALLVLDEATSALDTESERLIQQAMAELHGRTTMVVVAHRLSTIRHADLILVVEGGRIVEQGDHHTLMEQGGRYRDFYDLQHELQHSQVESAGI